MIKEVIKKWCVDRGWTPKGDFCQMDDTEIRFDDCLDIWYQCFVVASINYGDPDLFVKIEEALALRQEFDDYLLQLINDLGVDSD